MSLTPGRRWPWTVFAGLVVVYAGLAGGYAAATPPWNNPDEPAHYLYVADLAETGRLPVLRPGDWHPEILEPLIKSHFPAGASIDALRYESWQPPLYYLLAAPVYRLAPGEPRLARLHALHAFNVLLGAATLTLSYLVGRELFVLAPLGCSGCGGAGRDGQWLALTVPGLLVGVPMFAATSAAVNNDNLANLFGGLLTLGAVRLPLAHRCYRWSAALGLALGLGVLTKLTLGMFVPIVLAALAARSARAGDGTAQLARQALLMLGVMLLVLIPWLVRQGLVYGWDDLLAARLRIDVLGGRAFPSDALSYAPFWSKRLFDSAWGLFGWMQVQAPAKLYQLWAAVTQVALVGLLVAGVRSVRERQWRGTDPRPALLVAIVAAGLATLVYFNLTIDVQPQGRYVFVALAALAPLFVLGWVVLLPARARVAALCSLALGLATLNVYTLERVVKPGFST